MAESMAENVCGQVLQLPDLVKLYIHHKLGNTGSGPCEALAGLPFVEELSNPRKCTAPRWTIGSYPLTSDHFPADVDDEDYCWLAFLDIAIEAFNCNVEDYSYCLPVDFFLLTKEARDELFLAKFREKADYHSPERFQEKFWQFPWRILLPVQEKKDELLDVVFITNMYNEDEDTWECTIERIYSETSARYVDNSHELVDILTKTFVPVDDPYKVAEASAVPIAKKGTSTDTVGRLVALLLQCNNVHTLPIASVRRLLQHLHMWLHNAVYCYDPEDGAWVQCEVEACVARWGHRPRGSLEEWLVGRNDAVLSCHTLGKQCTFRHSHHQTIEQLQVTKGQLQVAKGIIEELRNGNETAEARLQMTIQELLCAKERIEALAEEKRSTEAAQAGTQQLHDAQEEQLKTAKALLQTQLQQLEDARKAIQQLEGDEKERVQELLCAKERIEALAEEKRSTEAAQAGTQQLHDAQEEQLKTAKALLQTQLQQLEDARKAIQQLEGDKKERVQEQHLLDLDHNNEQEPQGARGGNDDDAAHFMDGGYGDDANNEQEPQGARGGNDDDAVHFMEGGLSVFVEADTHCPSCGVAITIEPAIDDFNAFELPGRGNQGHAQRARRVINGGVHADCNIWWGSLDKINLVTTAKPTHDTTRRVTDTRKTLREFLLMRMASICKSGRFLDKDDTGTYGDGRLMMNYSSAAFIKGRIERFFRHLEHGESNISLVNPRTQLQHTLTCTIARRSSRSQKQE
jgi:hypothetical protein